MTKLNEPTCLSVWERSKTLLQDQKFIAVLWVLLAIVLSVTEYSYHSGVHNNYLIFKYTYLHAVDGLNLYTVYPEYLDTNHYGPFFSVLIAPFAMFPDFIGSIIWQLANLVFLYYAIKQLPLDKIKINAIYWIITHELITAMFSMQINPSIAAIIILSYVYIIRGNNFWAAFLILLGTFIKLYGIVGLAFFFFAKQKPKFILYCVFWAIVFFVLPMIFFSPSYILQSYQDWYHSLSDKQLENASLVSMQDRSVMGIVRRITNNPAIPNLPFILGGLLLFAVPYLRIKQYKETIFQLLFLASTLIFTVIFSNSSESPTYIIAFVGVAIWYVLQDQPKSGWVIAALVFALIVTSFYTVGVFPKYIRRMYIERYSLKALPCFMIWLVIIYQLTFKDFTLKQRLEKSE